MTPFERMSLVERRGLEILRPYLSEISDGRYALMSKGTLAKWLQESVGDVVMNDRAEVLWTIEIKCDDTDHHNFFLETWSNRNIETREGRAEHGSNVGWMMKSRADLLFYYFLDRDELFSINMFTLQRWAFRGLSKDMPNPAASRIYDFPERMQKKTQQANDTWGRCVPIAVLREELPPRAFKETQVRQRALLEATA